MDAHTAAQRLGITPRILRRIVRKHSSLQRAGMGGRYDFTEEDIKELEEIMARANNKSDGIAALDQSPGIPFWMVNQAHRDPAIRREIQARRREREERLAARIAELGGAEGIRRAVKAEHDRARARAGR